MSTRNHAGGTDAAPAPSMFKYFVGGSALLIAGCSAFFSVWGLGLLFVGSSTAVMVMASSLEVGKLVGASFLYRYWNLISLPLKIYLSLAIVALIAITSLGNYGYLARAYERTHTQITMLESQIASIDKEIADTQAQIDGSRGQVTKVNATGREDIAKIEQRVTLANEALAQSLARVQERRKAEQERRAGETATGTSTLAQSMVRIQERRKIAQERRDRDIQVPVQSAAERAEVLKKGIASEEAAVAGLNERIAVLDRAVDAYTKQGGPGFFKSDSIKKGQKLREEQGPRREAIKTELAQHRTRMEELQTQHTKQSETTDRDLAAMRDQFTKEMSRLDAEEQELRKTQTGATTLAEQQLSQEMTRLEAEEQTLRKAHAESAAQAAQQLTALQAQGQTTTSAGGTQVESLYQRMRTLSDEAHQLRNQIATSDIGSYRFVARAFEAPADDIVKWLMLALVLVFDPFAVCLMIGFNVALLRDRPAPRSMAGISEGPEEREDGAVAGNGGKARWMGRTLGVVLLALVIGGALVAAQQWRKRSGRTTQTATHSRFIPVESFAVATIRPQELKGSPAAQSATNSTAGSAGKMISNSLSTLLASGLDPQAPLYAFAKFPAKRAAEKSTRPVMLCGLVARVTDQAAAEATLSRLAAQIAGSLRAPSDNAPAITRNHAMIRHGTGRYMDPEGGFFSFALTEQTVMILIELEGDSQAPSVENEMKLWLAPPVATAGVNVQPRAQLPLRALNHDAAIALWLDAGKFFAALPKNAAAQTRYQQLQQRLGFDLVLQMKTTGENQLQIVADYAYQFDRFKDREQPGDVTASTNSAAADEAGLAGRLMERCVDTLDYTPLIERLRTLLGGAPLPGAPQLRIEKSFATAREGQFILLAPYDPAAGSPVIATVQTLFP